MIALLLAAALLSVSLAVVTFLQVLYLETLRLRATELPALTFFKETLQPRIGLKAERGALAFSLLKHTVILSLGVLFFALAITRGPSSWSTALEVALASWLAVIAAAYVVPQTLYRKTEGRWLLPLVPCLRLCAFVTRPVIAALQFLQSVVELAESGDNVPQPVDQAEHIDALITAGAEEGLFEERDRKLIQAAVAFGDKTVREVMTPRPNVVAIDAERSLEDLRQLVINEQYSRIPVFDGSIDRITGFVHVRDMFELDEEERVRRGVRELLRPIRFVPETKKVNDLVREMQQGRAHMAVVVDEYGNTAGLVTLEDLVEEIIGEIRDEHEPELDVARDPQGAYIVSGSFDVGRLRDLIEFRPAQEAESTTVGGMIAEWLGHVPRPGETVERDGIRLEVLAGNERRVEQVRVMRSHSAVSGNSHHE